MIAVLLVLVLLCLNVTHAQLTPAQIAAYRQLTSPQLPKLSNLAFGWVSMSGSDPTWERITSFAPTALVVRDLGYQTAVEGAVGRLTFGDLEVGGDFETAVVAVGPGLVKVSHFGFKSNRAHVAKFPAGYDAFTEGDAVEVGYAQRVGTVALGASLVPQDSTRVELTKNGLPLADGALDPGLGWRMGAVVPITSTVRMGGDYSYQADSATMHYVDPGLQMIQGSATLSSDFITRAATVGALWMPTKRLVSSVAYQNILVTGAALTNGRRNTDQVRAGVQYEFLPKLAARLTYIDGGMNYALQYTSPVGIAQVAYTHKALINADDILGEGHSLFAGLGLAW
jgi:hypothetical protein